MLILACHVVGKKVCTLPISHFEAPLLFYFIILSSFNIHYEQNCDISNILKYFRRGAVCFWYQWGGVLRRKLLALHSAHIGYSGTHWCCPHWMRRDVTRPPSVNWCLFHLWRTVLALSSLSFTGTKNDLQLSLFRVKCRQTFSAAGRGTTTVWSGQGRLKITRGPWATALRQAPLPQKATYFFF